MNPLPDLLPYETQLLDLSGDEPVGLLLVDTTVAFTRQGALADPDRMLPLVGRVDRQLRALQQALGERLHLLVFIDTHLPDVPEPPYPPHALQGSGEDELDPELAWVLEQPRCSVIRKDCIDGFIAAIDRRTGRNALVDWVRGNGIRSLLVAGDCTDICVTDLVLSLLSARNHGLFTEHEPGDPAYARDIRDFRVAVLADACDTYHAPGLHDRGAAQHVGFWMMASRGAIVAHDWRA